MLEIEPKNNLNMTLSALNSCNNKEKWTSRYCRGKIQTINTLFYTVTQASMIADCTE